MAGLMIWPILLAPDPLLGLVRELRDALEQAGRSHDNADIPWPWDKSLFVRADAALAEAPKAGEGTGAQAVLVERQRRIAAEARAEALETECQRLRAKLKEYEGFVAPIRQVYEPGSNTTQQAALTPPEARGREEVGGG